MLRKIHEMVHQGTTLSEALKNIRGDFLFWQREAPEKGKSTQRVADSVGEAQEGGKGSWPLGPTRSAKGSPPTPPRPHGRTTELSRIPKGWRTAEIITFTTSVWDHAACATGMPTPSQVTGGPTFPWMQDTPERLRLRLRWTPHPVPESSKPSLILLYVRKDDAGALDAYLHAYNPAFSEYIWAVEAKGWRSWTGHAGR